MIASIFQEASLPDTNTYLIISRKKYPDSETKYRDFGDGLVGIPVMIQNQMDVILKMEISTEQVESSCTN